MVLIEDGLLLKEKLCEHEVKAIVLETNPPWSSWCSCMAQDSEQWKLTHYKDRDCHFPQSYLLLIF